MPRGLRRSILSSCGDKIDCAEVDFIANVHVRDRRTLKSKAHVRHATKSRNKVARLCRVSDMGLNEL